MYLFLSKPVLETPATNYEEYAGFQLLRKSSVYIYRDHSEATNESFILISNLNITEIETLIGCTAC